tara:strand:+ start:738 stop:878 length:141 start_codon:yes stop_codon:yes gene_type:complete
MQKVFTKIKMAMLQLWDWIKRGALWVWTHVKDGAQRIDGYLRHKGF